MLRCFKFLTLLLQLSPAIGCARGVPKGGTKGCWDSCLQSAQAWTIRFAAEWGLNGRKPPSEPGAFCLLLIAVEIALCF